MIAYSILYPDVKQEEKELLKNPPEFFTDLNLDQVIREITKAKGEYALEPFYFSALQEYDILEYRQSIFNDLEKETLLDVIKAFADKMVLVRRYMKMVDQLSDLYHKEGWFLEAVLIYCDAICELLEGTGELEVNSAGLKHLLTYIRDYSHSPQFTTLVAESKELKKKLSGIQYNITIKDLGVKVQKYNSETDYSYEVEQAFQKFKQGDVKSYRIDLPKSSGMNHVEAQILNFVAKLFPEVFLESDNYYKNHQGFIDETIGTFDREIQFYVAYIDFIKKIKTKGLKLCLPQVTETSKDIYANDAYDIALALTKVDDPEPIVCNDFYLNDPERIIIVSGPNQGGKTTFARMFGQLHFLASLGCPVPGSKARLLLYDQIYTHFEKEEDIHNLRGKLQDDLVRIHEILDKATSRSIVIMNEIFTSTALSDAVFLSKEIIERIIQADALSVCVSFIDELSTMSNKTISMVSTVVPENPAQRTYKILRRPADGLAHALSIAEKHHLTYEMIKERISS